MIWSRAARLWLSYIARHPGRLNAGCWCAELAGMLDEVVAAFPRMYTHTALSKNEAALGDEWAALPAPRDRDRGARPSAAVIKVR